jgi:serralysin
MCFARVSTGYVMSSLGGFADNEFEVGLVDTDQFQMVEQSQSDEPILLQSAPVQNAGANTAPQFTGPVDFSLNEAEAASGVTLQAADADGDTIQFSIDGGGDAARFILDEDTGELTFVTPPDFDAPADFDGDNTYSVNITVSDGAEQQAETVEVTITATNPEPVAFEIIPPGPVVPFQPAFGFLSAVSTGVAMTLSAEDTDGNAASVTYSLFGEDAFAFNIDASTGAISVDDDTFLQGFNPADPSAGGLSFDGDAIFELFVLAEHASGTQDTQEIEFFVFLGG